MIETNNRVKQILEAIDIKELRQIQKESLPYLIGKRKQNLLVIAPSASGKTLIGEIALLNNSFEKMKSFYLVPLKSIANEKFLSFFRKYGSLLERKISIGISTGDFDITLEEIEKNDIVITTYERFDSIIRKRPEWIKKIGVVVIDEIHNLGDKSRGVRLESLLTRLMTYIHIQLIGLSATIRNPEDIANWMNAKLIKNNKRPIELRYKIIVSNDKYNTLKDLIPDLVKKKAQCLIFTRTRKESENLAKVLSKIVKNFLTLEEIEEIDSYSNNILDSMLDIKTLTGGVGYHHAGLDHNSRFIVEKMYKLSLLKIICCTTTLASGVNTPAKVVILKNLKMYKGTTNSVDFIDINKFHQIAGRAGRNEQDIGFAIILASSQEEMNKIKEYYFDQDEGSILKTKYENINSSFSKNRRSLIDQTLVFIHHHENGLNRRSLINFFKRTFYFHQNSRDKDDDYLIERFALDTKNIDILLRSTLEDITSIPEASSKITTISEKKIEGIVCSDIDKISYICAYFNDSRNCTCAQFKKDNFCRHLYHLGTKALEEHPKIARDIIINSYNQRFILEYLIGNDFILIENKKFKCTELGKLIVDLFLDTKMFLTIKNRLKYIESTFDFLELIKLLSEMDFNKSLSYHYIAVLNEIININKNDNIQEILKNLVTPYIGLGDLENFIETARWITNAIIRVAENSMDGNSEIVEIGKKIQESLLKPLPDEEAMSEIIQSSIALSSHIGMNEDKLREEFQRNLKYLLVLHKISGVTLYSQNYSLNNLDPALISGYLTAVSSFGTELSDGKDVNIKTMEYETFKVMLQEGEYIRVGLILDHTPEEWIIKNLKIFIEKVENKFNIELLEWNGNLNTFKELGVAFNNVFGIEK